VPLREAGIELTTRCGRQCAHCLRRAAPRPAADLDLALLERLVPRLAELGATHLGLTGGEPLLHPRIAEVGGLLAGLGATFHLVTGGGHAAELRTLIEASGPALTRAAVSLDGATAEVHDACRGEGSFAEVLQTLSVCTSRGIPVVAQMTVTRLNAHQLEGLAGLARELGVAEVRYIHCHPYGPARALALGPEERRSLVERSLRLDGDSAEAAPPGPADAPRCRFLDGEAVFVDARGRLLYCCLLAGLCPGDRDVVADLARVPLREGMAALERAHGRFREAVARGEVSSEQLDPREVVPCGLCARHLGVECLPA